MVGYGRAGLARAADLLARAAVTAGVVGLLFVAHEQWVTGWRHDRAQADLRAALAGVPAAEPLGGTTVTTPATVTAPLDVPVSAVGAPVATLRIPAIGVETVVVEGAGVATLREAPGRIGSSAPLGAMGASVVAGHRTTWGAPFGDLDRLRPGDVVEVARGGVTWRYRVTGARITTPRDAAVLAPASVRTLRLVTCHPRFSAARRLVVEAVAAEGTSVRAAVAPTAPVPARAPAGGVGPSLVAGNASDVSGPVLPAAVAAAVWLLGGLLARGRRTPSRLAWRLAALAGAALPLLVAFDRLDAALHA